MGAWFTTYQEEHETNTEYNAEGESSVDPLVVRPLSPVQLRKRMQASFMDAKLSDGVVETTYGRIMIIGPAAVGKTSLRHGLMNQKLLRPHSTPLADTRRINYGWTKTTRGKESRYWKEVTEDDETKELTHLLSRVHQLTSSPSKKSAIAGLLSFSLAQPAVHLFAPFAKVADLVRQHKRKVREVDELVEAIKEEGFRDILNKAFASAWDVEKDGPSLQASATRFEVVPEPSNNDPEVLMNVWDCGGQPVFLDVLPAFLTSRTIFYLVFDASKDLNARWSDVIHDNGTRNEGQVQNYSTIELLVHWMASIHAHLARHDDRQRLVGYPRILIIGTHADKLKMLPGDAATLIEEAIQHHCNDMAFNELLIGVKLVDNTTAGNGDQEDPIFKAIREETFSFAAKHLTLETPLSWILFRKLLHQYRKKCNKPVITLAEAITIGTACRMKEEDVPSVLNFYHELGVVLYYVHISSLSGLVICDPQWFIGQLALILSLKGQEIYKSDYHWGMLRKKGILTSTLYESVWQGSPVDPQTLIDLLTHFLLATPITCSKRDHYLVGTIKSYFVPSMLTVYTPSTPPSVHTEHYKKASPLYLIFSTGYVPPGYFIRLIAALAQRSEFQISFGRGVYRNRITMEYGEGEGTKVNEVTVMEYSDKVEITVACCVPTNPSRHQPFRDVCRNVLEALLMSSKDALQWLPSIQVDPAFICTCNKTKTSSSSSSITDVPLTPHDDTEVVVTPSLPVVHFAPFTLDQWDDEHLRCDHFSYILPSSDQKCWLEASDGKPSTEPHLPPLTNIELQRLSNSLMGKLEELAAALGMTEELQKAEEECIINNRALWFLKRWRRISGSRELLAEKLVEIGLPEIADKLRPREFPASPLRPTRSSLPVCSAPLSGSEIDEIAANIGDHIESLAVRLNMFDMYRDMLHNSNIRMKKLWFLSTWNSAAGDRSVLAEKLFDIGLSNLAEKVQCGQLVDVNTSQSSSSLPPGFIDQTSYMKATPTLPELVRCSRYIEQNADLSLLASLSDVSDEKVESLQQKHKQTSSQALCLLKIWLENVKGSRQELYELLLSLELNSAAESLKTPISTFNSIKLK